MLLAKAAVGRPEACVGRGGSLFDRRMPGLATPIRSTERARAQLGWWSWKDWLDIYLKSAWCPS